MSLPFVTARSHRGGAFAAAPAAVAGTSSSMTAPNEVDDLEFWLDAGANVFSDTSGTVAVDGDGLRRWNSRADDGSLFDVSWATGSVAVLESDPGGENGKPYANFVGKYMYSPAAGGATMPAVGTGTLFCVYQPTTVSGTNRYIARNHSVGAFILNGWNTDIGIHWGCDGAVYFPGAPDTDFAVITATCDYGNAFPIPRLNGGAPLSLNAHSRSLSSSYPLSGTAASAAGAYYLGYSSGAKHHLYHYFFYSRILSNSEMDGIHAWLADEYGVTQNTVTDS